MMQPLIAIDIDEVLAATTDALRVYVNEVTGHNLTEKHYQITAPYWGYYESVWRENGIEDMSLIFAYQRRMADSQDDIEPVTGALPALKELARDYRLLAITSRESEMETTTRLWLARHFGDIFDDVITLGHSRTAAETKGSVCARLGVKLLVDDNFEHCESALEAGVDAVVFGNYGWHMHDKDAITTATDWSMAVRIIRERIPA